MILDDIFTVFYSMVLFNPLVVFPLPYFLGILYDTF